MRARRPTKERQLANLALFRGCSSEDLRLVARLGDVVDVPAGHILANAASPSRDLAIVLDGVAVGSSSSGETVLLPGSCYGGFYDRPHALTVESLTPVRLIVFPQRSLGALSARIPSIAAAAEVWKSPAHPRRAERGRPCRRRSVRTTAMHQAV